MAEMCATLNCTRWFDGPRFHTFYCSQCRTTPDDGFCRNCHTSIRAAAFFVRDTELCPACALVADHNAANWAIIAVRSKLRRAEEKLDEFANMQRNYETLVEAAGSYEHALYLLGLAEITKHADELGLS